jgi:four helix bundle protein
MTAAYKNLVAWQRADDLFIAVHKLTNKQFPGFERYELAGQLRRAAYSVAANIVEGNARRYPRDTAHFFNIASASLAEVEYGLHAALRLGYTKSSEHESIDKMVRDTAAPLHGLIARLRAGRPLLSQVEEA